MNNIEIISVESRKGGVGKSTVAVNLASLLNQNHKVLLIDVDFTGTNINGFTKSFLWKDEFNSVIYNHAEINLLDYFQNHFQKGLDSIQFVSTEDSNQNISKCFQVRKDSINYIGSELYDENMSVICDPRSLFDELHSFWLIQMLNSICEAFEIWVSKQEEKEEKGIVILDNSPGFVGLGSAIHEWLTDVGPKHAKFLTVSSLDTQDLRSSLSSMNVIHKILTKKVDAAKVYHQLKKAEDKSDDLKVDEYVKSFVVHKLLSEKETDLSYYKKNEIIDPPKENEYQAIVINKVPITIRDNRRIFNYKKSLNNESLHKLLVSLCSREHGEITTIPFDSYIHYQLVREYVTSNNPDSGGNLSIITYSISRIKKLLMLLKQGVLKHISYIEILRNLDLCFFKLKNELVEAGYGQIAGMIEERWSPAYPLRQLEYSLAEIYSHSKGMLSMGRFSFRDGIDVKKFLSVNHPIVSKALYSEEPSSGVGRKLLFINETLCFYILEYCLDGGIRKELVPEVEKQLAEIIKIMSRKESLFLHNFVPRKSLLFYDRSYMRKWGVTGLYESFTGAQLRLYNLPDYMNAFIETIQLLINQEELDNQKLIDYSMNALMEFIDENEIANKDEFLTRLNQIKKESHEMQKIKEVLSGIVKRWQL